MNMGAEDIQKLHELVSQKLKESITKEQALRSLMDAGILNENGLFTKTYPNLAKAVKQS